MVAANLTTRLRCAWVSSVRRAAELMQRRDEAIPCARSPVNARCGRTFVGLLPLMLGVERGEELALDEASGGFASRRVVGRAPPTEGHVAQRADEQSAVFPWTESAAASSCRCRRAARRRRPARARAPTRSAGGLLRMLATAACAESDAEFQSSTSEVSPSWAAPRGARARRRCPPSSTRGRARGAPRPRRRVGERLRAARPTSFRSIDSARRLKPPQRPRARRRPRRRAS